MDWTPIPAFRVNRTASAQRQTCHVARLGIRHERHPENVARSVLACEPAEHKGVLARHQRLAALLGPAADRVPRGFDRALAELNVTSPQSMVLVMVGTYQPLSSADLARLTFLTRQAINVIIRNLEQRRQSFARRMRCMGGS
jgi:hypothetical protein